MTENRKMNLFKKNRVLRLIKAFVRYCGGPFILKHPIFSPPIVNRS